MLGLAHALALAFSPPSCAGKVGLDLWLCSLYFDFPNAHLNLTGLPIPNATWKKLHPDYLPKSALPVLESTDVSVAGARCGNFTIDLNSSETERVLPHIVFRRELDTLELSVTVRSPLARRGPDRPPPTQHVSSSAAANLITHPSASGAGRWFRVRPRRVHNRPLPRAHVPEPSEAAVPHVHVRQGEPPPPPGGAPQVDRAGTGRARRARRQPQSDGAGPHRARWSADARAHAAPRAGHAERRRHRHQRLVDASLLTT